MSDLPAQAEPKTALEVFREEVELLTTCGIIELAARNPRVMEYLSSNDAEIEALRTRAESAEALLAEAAIRLGSLVDGECTYVASEIRISATSHGDAIGRVSRARSTLSKIGDRT